MRFSHLMLTQVVSLTSLIVLLVKSLLSKHSMKYKVYFSLERKEK